MKAIANQSFPMNGAVALHGMHGCMHGPATPTKATERKAEQRARHVQPKHSFIS
jgi:hypothetical protein